MLKQFLGLTALMLLASCSSESAVSPTPEDTATPVAEATSAAEPANPSAGEQTVALAPDTYCYTIDNDVLTGVVRFTVDDAAQVKGESSVSIHGEEAGYYSSYAQNFDGDLRGDRAQLAVTTWIEYDRQASTETWTLTPETLMIADDVFIATDCANEVVTASFAGPDGLESKDLLAGLPAGQPIEFEPGTSGTKLENSVVRGERDVYRLSAQGGQLMTLDIFSLEDNAVFDVISPSGYVLARESMSESIVLPQTGDYQVIVGGTRGNATYGLEVLIE